MRKSTALRRSAGSGADDQDFRTRHQHVAAFDGHFTIASAQPRGIDGAGVEQGVVIENRLENARLAAPDAVGHAGNQNLVPDRNAGVTREKEIVQRRQRIAVPAQKTGQVVLDQRHPFDEHPGQFPGFLGQ